MITDENSANSSTVPPPTSEDDATKFTSLYWIGVALSFTFATTGNKDLKFRITAVIIHVSTESTSIF